MNTSILFQRLLTFRGGKVTEKELERLEKRKKRGSIDIVGMQEVSENFCENLSLISAATKNNSKLKELADQLQQVLSKKT